MCSFVYPNYFLHAMQVLSTKYDLIYKCDNYIELFEKVFFMHIIRVMVFVKLQRVELSDFF